MMRRLLAWCLWSLAGLGVTAQAVAASPLVQTGTQTAAPLVEVPFQNSLVVPLAGATQVVVVEDSICRAEVVPGGIKFFGLLQGDTIVFVWVGDTRTTMLIHVALPPPAAPRASLSPERLEQLGQGQMSTIAQASIDASRRSTYYFQHAFNWSQQVDGRRLSLRGQARHATTPDQPLNFDSLSVQYATPKTSLTFLDFGLSFSGGANARITRYSPIRTYVFRGVDVALTRGDNQIEMFGGTSIPASYRSYQNTNRIAGLNFNRKLSKKFSFYSTTAGVSVLQAGAGSAGTTRSASVFHTSGVTYRFNEKWAAQATGGASSTGVYGDGALAFEGQRLSAWTTWTGSSPAFSLNQVSILSGGGTNALAGATWKASSRLSTSLFYQHSATRPAPSFPSFAGRADYLNSNVNLRLSSSEVLTFNAVDSRNSGGDATGTDTSNRNLDIGWTSQLRTRLSNTAQVTWSASDDPLQMNNGVRMSLRDALTLRVKGGYLNVNLQQSRQDLSLVTRLRQQIGLLPSNLQELFLADPVAFVQSSSLPAEVRDLLDAIRSSNSQISMSGQFQLGPRLNLTGTYSVLRNWTAVDQHATTNAIGYVLSYRLDPSLQLNSSLSDTYFLDAHQKNLLRTTTFLIGLNKTFRGGPAWLAPAARDYKIDGRVFVDRSVSGTPDASARGLAGINVMLDDGRKAVTDVDGRYTFAGLKPGSYRVSMPLGQFDDPIKATTLTTVPVDLYEQPRASVNFGIVNFSRVMGTVYNDYALKGVHRGDSPGLAKVGVIVTDADGVARHVITDGSGEYRIDDLSPGKYRLEVDGDTIPANYMYQADHVTFEVKPTQTLVIDVPMRALRSVAGYVLLADPSAAGQQGEAPPVPVAGVTVVAGDKHSTTDAEGRFILRDLPAGEIVVTLQSAKPLPEGLTAPTGTLRMPKEPIGVDRATIVIRNTALLDYLVIKKK